MGYLAKGCIRDLHNDGATYNNLHISEYNEAKLDRVHRITCISICVAMTTAQIHVSEALL